ncbi:hypothetical protein GCM10009730_59130 [Streptomyces albidochromogenes]
MGSRRVELLYAASAANRAPDGGTTRNWPETGPPHPVVLFRSRRCTGSDAAAGAGGVRSPAAVRDDSP